jgi:hypothetical protein
MTITDVSQSKKIYQGYRFMLVFTCTDIWYNFSFLTLTCQKSYIKKKKNLPTKALLPGAQTPFYEQGAFILVN